MNSENKSLSIKATVSEHFRELLIKLWRQQLSVILANLVNDKREHEEIASAAHLIGIDYKGRFLLELIQNGYDAIKKSGPKGGKITIVRQQDFIAVANQGVPFDDEGLKNITSLAISDKDPSQDIGNKGVGFKSVFEVTREPIVLSSSRSALDCKASGLRFKLSETPFAESREELVLLAEEVLSAHAEQAEQLSGDRASQVAFLTAAADKAAGFKFPLGISHRELEAWAQRLPELAGFQTVVILPTEEKASENVQSAITELWNALDEVSLFLPGLAQITLHDYLEDRSVTVRRKPKERCPTDNVTVRIERVRISRRGKNQGTPYNEKSIWWIASRELGSRSGNEDEAKEIRQAVMELGRRWHDVDCATVRVALPAPSSAGPSRKKGLFAIGLPTEKETGTPFWVDSAFYSKISRKDIDFNQARNPYNALLLQAASSLAEDLLESLKKHPKIHYRRLVTFSRLLQNPVGELAKLLHGDGCYFNKQCFLSLSGNRFLLAGDLRLPRPRDLNIITALGCSMKTLAEFGFVLTDPIIMQHLESLLREDEAAFVESKAFIDRRTGRSLIEAIAGILRDRNAFPKEWGRFLNWLLSWQLSPEQLETLRNCEFLPVVGGGLLAPRDDIFIPPWKRRHRQSVMDDESSEEFDDTEYEDEDAFGETLDQLQDVRKLLHFLDDCIVVRQPNGRLTELGRGLKPDDPQGLVRRPRAPELIRCAISPALQQVLDVEADYAKAVRLLEAVIAMLHRPRAETSITAAKEADFLLPTALGWKHWRPASELYFGRGWLESIEDEELLRAAIGSSQDNSLISWEDFKETAGDRRGLDWWRRGLEWIGIARLPRVIVRQVRGRPSPPFKASKNYNLAVNSYTLPGGLSKTIEPYWHKYLDSIQHRKSSYKTPSITYDFDHIAWIEGLEDEQRRSAVVDLILKYPEFYHRLSANLHRSGSPHEDVSTHDALWVFTLKSEENWRVFRSDDGERLRPDELWHVEHRDRGPETRYAHLRCASPGFDRHQPLLARLGVSRLEDGDAKRIVRELQRQAGRLHSNKVEPSSRSLLALVVDLYDRLDQVCIKEDKAVLLDNLFAQPVPLLYQNFLTSIDLNSSKSVFIDDSKERRPYVAGQSEGLYMPVRSRMRLENLADLLASKMEVRFTSRAELGIRLNNLSEPESLLAFLEKMRGEESLVSLGCIVAYCGHDSMDPGKERFNSLWGALKDTSIRFADIEENSLNAIYDVSGNGKTGTLIVRRAQDQESVILRGLWQVLGHGYMYVLDSYVDFLRRGLASEFLNKANIGPHERHSVKEALSLYRKDVLLFHYPSLLLLRRAIAPETAPPDLVSMLAGCRDLAAAIDAVSPQDQGSLELDLATEDQVSLTLKLIDSAGFSVKDWQIARAEFNMEPFVFSDSRESFLKARQRTFAVLKSSFVRKPRISFDLGEVQLFLEEFARNDPPDEILYKPREAKSIGRVHRRSLLDLLPKASTDIQKHLHPRIEEWTRKGTEFPSVAPRLEREISEYQCQDDETRVQNAMDTFHEYEMVIKQLGALLGENVANVLEDQRIGILTRGWWANKYALLRHIGQTLRKHSPRTAGKLATVFAFRRPLCARELRLKLGLDDPHSEKPTPVTKTVVGVPIPEDQIDSELMKGPLGAIGLALRGHLSGSIDLVGMAKRARDDAKAPERKPRDQRPHGSRKPPRPRGSDALVGCLGEAFAYELFSLKFSDHGFDHTCWKSENKHRYLGIEGSELLGYDLEWLDIHGLLAAPGQNCLIEVKSSSGRDEAFPISAPEWERAKAAHHSPDETYIIVRVIDTLTKPQISDVMIDPVQLEEDGKLIVQKFDGLLLPGRLME